MEMQKILPARITEKLIQQKEINLATHDGVFHGDEVFATAILQLTFGKSLSTVMRGRLKPGEQWNSSLDIIYDVGGQYDGERFYDHHQGDLAARPISGIPYSSAGLIWKHFGYWTLRTLNVPEAFIERIWEEMDRDYIQGIDATDCGARELLGTVGLAREVPLSSVVSVFNANDKFDNSSAFTQVVAIARDILKAAITSKVNICSTEAEVMTAIENAKDGIMYLPKPMPWQTTLFNSGKDKDINLVVWKEKENEYRIQAVSVSLEDRFNNKFPLPEGWRALDSSTDKMLGGCKIIFTHKTGFIAGVSTAFKSSAIEAAKEWLSLAMLN